MTDEELQEWWPALGTVVTELRLTSQSAVADLLIDSLQGAACSSEVLGGIRLVLRECRGLRAGLSASGVAAWDAVMADVYRAFPSARFTDWFAGLKRR